MSCVRIFYCGTDDNNDGKRNRTRRGSQLSQKLSNKSKENTAKTEPCSNWLLTGTCEHGPICQFAHVPQEPLALRHMHDAYKLEVCKNISTPNGCRFGSRCDFLHHELRIQVSEHEYWLIDLVSGSFMIELTDICQRNARRIQRLKETVIVQAEYVPSSGQYMFWGK